MCLILIAHNMSENLPLLVLANRDEYYNRPTAAAAPWDECREVIAGRDLVSGGTWFGASGMPILSRSASAAPRSSAP